MTLKVITIFCSIIFLGQAYCAESIDDSNAIQDAINMIQTSVEASGNFELYEGDSYYGNSGAPDCDLSSKEDALKHLQGLTKSTPLSESDYTKMSKDFLRILGEGKFLKCSFSVNVRYYMIDIIQYKNLDTKYKINFEEAWED